ncbi:MAG: AAA family ATPase [Acidobacteria bacterium]|nr:AAA family ATPase [Acidobacteriota bacterium]
MIRRIYVHNFRCLENFDLSLAGHSSALLIGKNGSGKTTVGKALEIFQRIARGTNRVGDLVKPSDLSRGRADAPVRFTLEVDIAGRLFDFTLALELPDGFRELRILEEDLKCEGKTVYTRQGSQVSLPKTEGDALAKFHIDWHLVALPIVQEASQGSPILVLKQWLARMVIVQPIPPLIKGDSEVETLEPDKECTKLAAWFAGLMAYSPSAYSKIDNLLRQVMPDFKDIRNPLVGKDARSLEIQFAKEGAVLKVPFADLSDGEKCFLIGAMVTASDQSYGPLFCFWDEPDNYLAPDEIGHFIIDMRHCFGSSGQWLATSHNPEAITRFADENTFLLYRNSHMEPTIVRPLSDLDIKGDLAGALVRGDVVR